MHSGVQQMNLFGKKQAKGNAVATSTQRINPVDTIRSLRESLETLEKREVHISKKVELALAEAKQKASKQDKRGLSY